VTGLGSASYDVFAASDRERTFYLWGAMGGAAALGLGLAIAQPACDILVITGDGEQLMGLGALATIGVQRPCNLSIVVLDNGYFGETGMQHSHTSLGVDLIGIAKACGFEWTLEIDDVGGAADIATQVKRRAGCGLARVCVKAEELPRALPPRDGVYVKNRFRAALGFAPL
jgi:thiamine pyrophosphate-dependent acetolactate synthase large subunit-like protein